MVHIGIIHRHTLEFLRLNDYVTSRNLLSQQAFFPLNMQGCCERVVTCSPEYKKGIHALLHTYYLIYFSGGRGELGSLGEGSMAECSFNFSRILKEYKI